MDLYFWTRQCWLTGKKLRIIVLSDTGCTLDDLPGVMVERDTEKEREREREGSMLAARLDDDDGDI